MKKLIAALSAVTMLLGIVPMGVSAYNDVFDVREKENLTKENFFEQRSNCYYLPHLEGITKGYTSGMPQFLLITDGTAPPEESFADMPDFKSCTALEMNSEDIEPVTYWDLKLPNGTVVYEVELSSTEHLIDSARQYFLANAFVQNIYLTRKHTSNNARWNDNRLNIRLNGDYPEEGIPGLTGYVDKTYYVDGVKYGSGTVEFDETYLAELSVYDRRSTERIVRAMEICNQIEAQSKGLITNLCPSFEQDYNLIWGYTNYSIWLNNGDTNGDQIINASDAAEVLIAAAMTGAGRSIDTDTSWDVNLDGTVNASDAACILIYAAQAGADGSADWQNILR